MYTKLQLIFNNNMHAICKQPPVEFEQYCLINILNKDRHSTTIMESVDTDLFLS